MRCRLARPPGARRENRLVAWAFGQPEPMAGHQTGPCWNPARGAGGSCNRLRAVLDNLHPAVAVVVGLVGCVILMAAVLIVLGLLMVHFGAHDRLGHWDEHVNQWFARHRAARWDRLSGDFTVLADTTGIVAVATVVTVLLLLRRWGRFAWLLAAGLAVELTVFLATNYAVQRPRPPVAASRLHPVDLELAVRPRGRHHRPLRRDRGAGDGGDLQATASPGRLGGRRRPHRLRGPVEDLSRRAPSRSTPSPGWPWAPPPCIRPFSSSGSGAAAAASRRVAARHRPWWDRTGGAP